MSSPIDRTESPSLDEHAKRKRDERDALEKQSGGALTAGSEPEADPEAMPPKKIKPEVDAKNASVSGEVKKIQRELKTMPLEDTKNPNSAEIENKDMDDVKSDHGSNGDHIQDKVMEEHSVDKPDSSNGRSNSTSNIESKITITQKENGKNEPEQTTISATPAGSNTKLGGFSNTSAVSPFASVKPVESVFGSTSSTLKGFGAASSVSPFGSVEKNDVFGSSKSSFGGFSSTSSGGFGSTSSGGFGSTSSGGFGNTASSGFGRTTSSGFGNSASSGFGNTSSISPFAAVASTNIFGSGSSTTTAATSTTTTTTTTTTPDTSTPTSTPTSTTDTASASKDAAPSLSVAPAATESAAGSVFGARSIIGSAPGVTPVLHKPTPFPARLKSTSGTFNTFGSFSESSFNSGSFIDHDNSNDQDFGSLLSQDTGDDGNPEQDGDDNFGTGIFTNADQIDVQTGEEDEVSIFQTKGKLYADTEKNHAWKERGKGAFKVNISQKDPKQARLVMRTDGALRLILNVSIFPEMSVAITGEKYVRFIGIEEDQPLPFLLKVKDAAVANGVVESIKRASERQARGKNAGKYAVTLKE
ncbi:hypothetical protein BGZ76_000322 [Entomortierella beljakovae]|nr:hypothetical protein BGZ76_000322 [Entomortierella beljakovae]